MPTIPIYLKDRVYFRLAMEADKMQVGIGKLCSMILENYVNYLEKTQIKKEDKNLSSSI